MFINIKGHLLSLNQPIVMGILNITENSFYDGGRYTTEKTMLQRVEYLLTNGATLIDIGAVSTAPGTPDLDEHYEASIIHSTLASILKHFPNALISVDTWRNYVAQIAIDEGAGMINDISGGSFEPQILDTIARYKIPYCLMHTSNKPDVMQLNTHYDNFLADIIHFFGLQIDKLKTLGVNDIIIDPGFGFGKTMQQNYFLLNNLSLFHHFNLPLLVGISRKSMIYKVLDCSPQDALNGTSVLHAIALLNGANILRAHDPLEAVEAIKLIQQLKVNEILN